MSIDAELPPRRGAVMIVVALMLVAVLGLAALSVDAGNMNRERRNTQIAADAAADAASLELLSHFSTNRGIDVNGQAKTAAYSIAAAHGYSGENVTVNIPPLSGAFSKMRGYAEVIITTHPPRFFSRIFAKSELDVVSRAVAAGTAISTQAGVLILDPKIKNSLRLKGSNSSLTVAGDVIVNSTNKTALSVGKKAQLTAAHVLVSGGLGKNSKRNIEGDVLTGVEATPNPWSSLPPPSKGESLKVDDFKVATTLGTKYNLQPGTYKSLKFDKDDSVYMSPGVYYVDGGGFELKGNSSVQAQEVMIYNSGTRGFKVTTKGEVSISPPKSGIYKGISLFQDSSKRTKVEFSKQDIKISGILYAPNSEIKFKKSEFDISTEDDPDWLLEELLGEEVEANDNDNVTPLAASFSGALVAGKLTIENNTQLTIRGADIGAYRPLSGVVE